MKARTRRWIPGSGRRGSRHQESGMALLLTLGFLSVMLMMVLVLAMSARTGREAASAGADAVRGQLVAESALGEAVARVAKDYRDVRYPADDFYKPSADSAWAGRYYLASDDKAGSRAGIKEALSTRFSGVDFTPEADLSSHSGWIPMTSKQYVDTGSGAVTKDVLIGRYSYVVIDESGKIDPGAVVQQGVPEASDLPNLTTVDGSLISEFSLSTLGFANADRFCPEVEDDYVSGKMPLEESRWFGMDHLASGMGFTQSEMDLAVKTLFPYSFDREQFWRDRNNNGRYDANEEADRLDIHAFPDLSKVYHIFVGPVKDYGHRNENGELDAGHDDCDWLKELDNNPWFTSWKNAAFASYTEPERTYRARSHVAAQVAANIVDYADPDNVSTSAYLDERGQINLGYNAGLHNVSGVERTWALSQIAMRVEADSIDATAGGTGDTTTTLTPNEEVPFTIHGGRVIPAVPYEVTVTILGAELSMRDYDGSLMWWCPVTTNFKIGSTTYEPWGAIDDVANDIQDFNYPKPYLVPGHFAENTPITVSGKFWTHPYNSTTGTYDTTSWYIFRALASDTASDHVFVLRDGDSVPSSGTTDTQDSVSYYLEEYIEGDAISLQANQAIYLFETRTPNQGYRDFQDLVVLVTLTKYEPQTITTVKEQFSVEGPMCNINPNNSSAMQFVLTLNENGDTITRDDMHSSRSKLMYPKDCVATGATASAVHVHVRPKGNANDNYIYVDGVRFDLENGKVYDFHGNLDVALWNEQYHSNGRAMGHWWLGFGAASSDVKITVDGEPYLIEVEETVDNTDSTSTTTTTPSDDPADPTAGNSLRVRAGFQAEVVFPWEAGAELTNAPSAIEVTYRVDLSTATGAIFTHRATKTIVPDTAAESDGGTLMWNADFHMDDWITIENAFDLDNNLNSYVVDLVRIEKVVVKDAKGFIADTTPWGPTVRYEAYGDQLCTGDAVFHMGVTPRDPFMNERGCDSSDFNLFWEVYPANRVLAYGADSAPTDFGVSSCSYNSGTYAGIDVRNSLIRRLGELGRVHSYMPNQSLRLWSASHSDEGGHDADILDVFKIGSQVVVRGRVNINSLQPEVLKALFTDALDVNVDAAVDELLARRANGKVFTNIGQIFGDIAEMTPSSPLSDAEAEQAAVKLAEKLTVRSNYFSVIICAQAVQDVDGVPYTNSAGETVTAKYGTFDVASGDRYVDRILAEQKLLAVVYRDALTNKTRIERVEVLHE